MKKVKIEILLWFLSFLSLLSCSSVETNSEQLLIINEYMVSNDSTTGLKDIDGKYRDWVEAYNGGVDTIRLQNFYISDTQDDPQKYNFPNIMLAPQDYYLVWSGTSSQSPWNHLGFSFSTKKKNGEQIILSDSLGNRIEVISYLTRDDLKNSSIGRNPDGSKVWKKQRTPSPNLPNKG